MNEFRMLLTKDPQFPIIRLDLRSSISDRPLSTFFLKWVYTEINDDDDNDDDDSGLLPGFPACPLGSLCRTRGMTSCV